MASVAEPRRSGITLRMAFHTIRTEMRSPDLEFPAMLKRRIPPVRRYGRMACLAVGGETGQDMIGILSRGEIVLMATLAIQGGACEFLAALLDMAGLAIDYGVNSHQGKTPRRVPLEKILPILPAMRRVAILAFYPELASMDVGVAIGAFHPDIGEFQILMATKAFHTLVVSCQGEPGRGVIELQRISESIPGASGMTRLAIPLDITVGVGHRLLAAGRKINRGHHEKNYYEKIRSFHSTALLFRALPCVVAILAR
jgi:hypothetical protein